MDEAATMLADIGYRKPVTKLTVTDIEALKCALVDHHCMLKVKAYIDQFIEGLEVLGQGIPKDFCEKFEGYNKYYDIHVALFSLYLLYFL